LSLDQQFLGDQKSLSLWKQFRNLIQGVASQPAVQMSGWVVAYYEYVRINKLLENLNTVLRQRNFYRAISEARNAVRVDFVNRQQEASNPRGR
jgi:hypothetical protein